jgi:hypothetical protein
MRNPSRRGTRSNGPGAERQCNPMREPPPDGYRAVMRLAEERPELVALAVAVAAQAAAAEPWGGEFPGAWALERLPRGQRPEHLNRGLRTLVAYGVLEKASRTGSSARPAFYRVPDPADVRRGLEELG